MHQPCTRFLLALLGAVTIAGCDRGTSGPTELGEDPGPAAADDLRDVPGALVSLGTPRDFDTDDAALEAALRESGGRAFVAFKSPASRRLRESGGRRSPLSRLAAAHGLRLLRQSGVQVLQMHGALGVAYVRIPEGRAPSLRTSPLIDYIEPLPEPAELPQPTLRDGAPSRSLLVDANLIAQTTPWNITFVGAPGAWPATTGSAKVMLINGGIRPYGHSDLPQPPSGNCAGYINSCFAPFINGNLMLGIIAARNNTIDVVGIAHGVPDASVFSWRARNSEGVDWNLVVGGINAAVSQNIKVVLLDELATTANFQVVADVIATAWSSGVITVAGAGDITGTQLPAVYPASYNYVVGVSGVRQDGSFAGNPTASCSGNSSNWGTMVDVAAPFYATTTLSTGFADTRTLNNGAGFCSTGLAAAHIAGILVLVRSYFPAWTPQQAVDALLASGSNHAAPNQYIGHGVPDAAEIFEPPPPALPPITVTIFNFTEVQPYAECLWVAGVSGGDGGPYNLSWTVDGVPVGDGTPNLRFANWGGADFTIMLNVTDNSGGAGGDTHYVIVNPYANYCWDM